MKQEPTLQNKLKLLGGLREHLAQISLLQRELTALKALKGSKNMQDYRLLCQTLNRLIAKATKGYLTALWAIEQVQDPLLQNILHRRWVMGQTMEQIADETFYSLRRLYQLHQKALAALPLHQPEDET